MKKIVYLMIIVIFLAGCKQKEHISDQDLIVTKQYFIQNEAVDQITAYLEQNKIFKSIAARPDQFMIERTYNNDLKIDIFPPDYHIQIIITPEEQQLKEELYVTIPKEIISAATDRKIAEASLSLTIANDATNQVQFLLETFDFSIEGYYDIASHSIQIASQQYEQLSLELLQPFKSIIETRIKQKYPAMTTQMEQVVNAARHIRRQIILLANEEQGQKSELYTDEKRLQTVFSEWMRPFYQPNPVNPQYCTPDSDQKDLELCKLIGYSRGFEEDFGFEHPYQISSETLGLMALDLPRYVSQFSTTWTKEENGEVIELEVPDSVKSLGISIMLSMAKQEDLDRFIAVYFPNATGKEKQYETKLGVQTVYQFAEEGLIGIMPYYADGPYQQEFCFITSWAKTKENQVAIEVVHVEQFMDFMMDQNGNTYLLDQDVYTIYANSGIFEIPLRRAEKHSLEAIVARNQQEFERWNLVFQDEGDYYSYISATKIR